jgi:hypothetical protein
LEAQLYLRLAVVVVDRLVEEATQPVCLPVLGRKLSELAEHFLHHGLGEEDGVLECVDAKRLGHVHGVDHAVGGDEYQQSCSTGPQPTG